MKVLSSAGDTVSERISRAGREEGLLKHKGRSLPLSVGMGKSSGKHAAWPRSLGLEGDQVAGKR